MGCSTHGAIQESAFVTQEFRDKCRDLLAKYLPIGGTRVTICSWFLLC